MLRACVALLVVALSGAAPAAAAEAAAPEAPAARWCSEGRYGPARCIRRETFARDVCAQIEAEARQHALPPAFLARLLWQESRFDPNAVSPMAARGIAQFIDGTAKLRGLRDQFNPAESIEKSAHYLAEMARRYGNVGLAAIGYNGGERRAEGWIAGTGGLARETLDYVRIITGASAETWRDAPPEGKTFALDGGDDFRAACEAMARTRRVSPLAAPPPRLAPWGVQVGYGADRGAAQASFARQTSSCAGLANAARRELVTVRGRGPGRPDYVAVRLAAPSRDEAEGLCRRLARAGCVCRVFRNP
ncbi:lytic transglycosylase domain-containing protein [Jannaschia sp. W003]|uniref:lytic transglycosylase domain-containing protein n=1 Tax=Jannaschia sp. W003 TaxID=2867012 RepID=UPI0021A30884|nr:lytic transglycosylase domain-containing protein [Jannaschia sp. W003]UWQ22788.1 lytic transglycosylase domain-containing protein [Jannaschia sp. W003]